MIFLSIILFWGINAFLVQGQCLPKNNTMGKCGCDDQIFVSNDCRRVFFCQDRLLTAEGCEVECPEGQISVPNPRNGTDWYCIDQVNEDGDELQCPGGWNTFCGCRGEDEECPLAACECDGQLSVNNNCTHARLCDSSLELGYEDITCSNTSEIIYVDLLTYETSCGPDDGRCPGAFKVGCDTDTSTESPADKCNPTNNPYGECECPGQLFYGSDCLSAFYCMSEDMFPDGVNSDNAEGCQMECEEGKLLVPDPRNGGDWFCVSRTTPGGELQCPGAYQTSCPCEDGGDDCNPIGECHCNGELLLQQDCKYARICDDTIEVGYDEFSCDGYMEIIYVDLETYQLSCGLDDGRCPGALHVGCGDHDHSETSSSTTSSTSTSKSTSTLPTSTTTSSDAGALGAKIPIIMIFLYLITIL